MRFQGSVCVVTGKYPLSNDSTARLGDLSGWCVNDTHAVNPSSQQDQISERAC
jgi:hypothetical protein